MKQENLKTKEILDCIKKLNDEGYINFKNNKQEIIDFLENDMQYIVFEKDGQIGRYNSCHVACGKLLFQVKKLKVKGSPTELDQKYFNDNHLRMNWFNFICWKKLGVIFLNKFDHGVIKFNKDKDSQEKSS